MGKELPIDLNDYSLSCSRGQGKDSYWCVEENCDQARPMIRHTGLKCGMNAENDFHRFKLGQEDLVY